MEDFLRFLNTNELTIYGFLGVIFLIYLRKLIIAWGSWKTAVFGLEKESAQRKLSAAVTITSLIGLMLLSEFVIISFVVPAYPKSLLLPTPTLDLFATPTATLSVLGAQNLAMASDSVSTPAPDGASGCIPGQVGWSAPVDGDEVSGVIELNGTVNVPTMGFYKFEYSAVGSNAWMTIAAGNDIKIDEYLEVMWNTTQLVPGDYILRLVVTDNLNNPMLPCDISVRVVSEE